MSEFGYTNYPIYLDCIEEKKYISAQTRYHHDPVFNRMVKMMVNAMDELQLTPTEIREAAGLAALLFYQKHPQMPFIQKEVADEKV